VHLSWLSPNRPAGAPLPREDCTSHPGEGRFTPCMPASESANKPAYRSCRGRPRSRRRCLTSEGPRPPSPQRLACPDHHLLSCWRPGRWPCAAERGARTSVNREAIDRSASCGGQSCNGAAGMWCRLRGRRGRSRESPSSPGPAATLARRVRRGSRRQGAQRDADCRATITGTDKLRVCRRAWSRATGLRRARSSVMASRSSAYPAACRRRPTQPCMPASRPLRAA
jgi:hypothetical protein